MSIGSAASDGVEQGTKIQLIHSRLNPLAKELESLCQVASLRPHGIVAPSKRLHLRVKSHPLNIGSMTCLDDQKSSKIHTPGLTPFQRNVERLIQIVQPLSKRIFSSSSTTSRTKSQPNHLEVPAQIHSRPSRNREILGKLQAHLMKVATMMWVVWQAKSHSSRPRMAFQVSQTRQNLCRTLPSMRENWQSSS